MILHFFATFRFEASGFGLPEPDHAELLADFSRERNRHMCAVDRPVFLSTSSAQDIPRVQFFFSNTTCPPLIVVTTFSSALLSRHGSPSTITMSANLPTSSVPISAPCRVGFLAFFEMILSTSCGEHPS